MKVKDIINILNSLAPPYLVDKWDNSGFQLGNLNEDVKRILISIDISNELVDFAIKRNVNMIITHHPLIFDPIKSITLDNYKGRMIYKLIKNDISVISAHTNLDVCDGGVNDVLADILSIKNRKILSKSYIEKLYKIVVFVPEEYSDKVRRAMTEAGAGYIGNYRDCTFNINGTGTFTPLEGTNPFIGKLNEMETVEETRIETIVKERDLNMVLSKMISVHPYEEVAYDVYMLKNDSITYGYGRIGELDSEMTLKEFSNMVKNRLNCKDIRVYGNLDKKVRRVAVCGGSGADFIRDVFRKNGDVYVTGDIKHHQAQYALELGIAVIDAGHYYTERVILDKLKNYLKNNIKEDIDILVNENNEIDFSIY